MLMTDDTGWNDFGAYSGGGAALGHPTPNIDQIAKEGAIFTSWYGQASCTAGRSSFITGRIPIRSALSIVVAPGDGRNVRMDVRWDGGDADRLRALAQELVGLQPDIILTGTIARTAAFQRETRTIPIVFTGVGDPVASGIVVALNQPGGNSTGFALFEESLAGKWLELLSEPLG
jgi:hypothetical protein